tara:strand:+ start:172 stop:624 length:453 start_codon:yes stop_codon:yes gene_type:complete
MNKNSESFNIARHQYIKGYQDKKELIFPTLGLIAKEFSLTLSTLRKKAANEGWYQKRKHYQNVREEYELRKQFKGKYSKLAQISRNTLVFAEYFQLEIHKEIQEEKKGKKIHSIEDKQRLITMTQKIQRLSKEANDTLTDIENPLNELID